MILLANLYLDFSPLIPPANAAAASSCAQAGGKAAPTALRKVFCVEIGVAGCAATPISTQKTKTSCAAARKPEKGFACCINNKGKKCQKK